MFAFTLLSSVKQARSLLRQQRAVHCAVNDKAVAAIGSAAGEPANASQSDFNQILNRYRETEMQVCCANNDTC